MTSEVIMLNKDAVVIAADSAVTTGRNPHPRYSKAANKIFDVSVHGNVAVTIFATGEIDRVPWELTLKQFRSADSTRPARQHLAEYIPAIVQYLERNNDLFPRSLRDDLLKLRVGIAAANLLDRIAARFPEFVDKSGTQASRTAAWTAAHANFAAELAAQPFQAPLAAADQQAIEGQAAAFEAYIGPLVVNDLDYLHANVTQLVRLAIEHLLKNPTEFLPSSGLVFAGYGSDEIFPSFVQVRIFGHIGEKFLWIEEQKFAIGHDNNAWIQPFAQSSMMNRFTDGFDGELATILSSGCMASFKGIVADLRATGINIPDALVETTVAARQLEFMTDWKKKAWDVNFHPLRRVLNSLSVPEMGHLAESLLVLEALRERVTSPSESIGGPIDVAAITKSEGLIWLKRKHFFEPHMNLRYLNRVKLAPA